jgi:SAM-dependent methyltransferase
MAVSNPHFNKVSGTYDRGRVSEDIWFWAGEAEKIAKLNAGSLVVDMGCGTGNYGLGIATRTGCTVIGFDPSIGMLKQAREKAPEFPIVQAVGEHMPYRSNVFDLVYAAVLRKGGTQVAHTIGHAQLHEKVVFKFFPEIKQGQLDAYPSDEDFKKAYAAAGLKTEIAPYLIERYQTADELIEIAEGKLWSMFRPITKEGLEKGVAMLKKWEKEHPNEPIRNDEMITLFVGRK